MMEQQNSIPEAQNTSLLQKVKIAPKISLAVTLALSFFGLGFIIFSLAVLFGGILNPPRVEQEGTTTIKATQIPASFPVSAPVSFPVE